ncbi:PREDICTED: serine/threonine-protein kinase 10 isoform X2 [Nicrophorus vespilloides]|uniref:Serine/threonine-protein kinase 10 isoform X2 n=1 Tax=Nicrophorus vespilloides TaxID=110193 RepID=A0ABM1NAX6_NICVS|nr:PREDICTED: serine/threonine-protein kinase 10 isoform X2 [Nicrophorus vespilloides]
MSFFNNIKKALHLGGNDAKKKKVFNNVRMDCDPAEFWDMIGELGDGAYGKVYKAQHKHTGQLAAAKMCRLDGDDDLADFMVEIDILSECKHINIVELHEAFQKEQQLWMLIEYCDGGALDSIMTELEKPLNELQIAYVCQNMCKGLEFLHRSHIIHRDLKAGNVLLTMAGGVKLADFGVSAKNKCTLQKHDTFIGTPYWMAPEVVLCETFRDNPYDFKVDIWSMGITLIEFAQMEPPNHEMSPMRVLLKIQKSDPPKLEQPSKFSKEFNDFISTSLVKDPQKRPTCETLLRHPFINRTLDSKPLCDLLLEYRAEVVEEEVTDEDAERGRKQRKNKELYQRIGGSPGMHTQDSRTSHIEDDCNSVQSNDVDAKVVTEASTSAASASAAPVPPPPPPKESAPEVPQAHTSKMALAKKNSTSSNEGDKKLPEKRDEVHRKTSREKGPAPPPPPLQIPLPPEKGPAPAPPVPLPILPTPPSSPLSPPATPPPIPPPDDNAAKDIMDVAFEKLLTEEKNVDLPDAVPEEAVVAIPPPPPPPMSSTASSVVVNNAADMISNMVVVSTQADSNKMNTSTIIINDVADPSNSLASNISQVTVVTTHPPVLVDNNVSLSRSSPSSSASTSNNEVVIVSNETNKTRVNEASSSTTSTASEDECYPSLDSLDYLGQTEYRDKPLKKLDESEVLIVDSNHLINDSGLDVSPDNSRLLDTSHVSVVRIDEERVQVKDSATFMYDDRNSVQRLSGGDKNSSNNTSSSGVEDKKLNGDNYVSSECGSSDRAKSDVESISIASHDSNKENKSEGNEEEVVVLRKKTPHVKSKEELMQHNLNRKTRKRTRKFVIDGVVITTTTSKVIYGDEDNFVSCDPHADRKQELRELKYLQKQEQKQFQELAVKESVAIEQQEKKFEQERLALDKTYETDLDMLTRQQKMQIERAETQQDADLRTTSKKIRADQERDLKQFREGLKQEVKLLKAEIERLHKDQRKNEFKLRKDKLDAEHSEREKLFLEKLNDNHESSLRRLSDSHREKIALMERQFLQQKQQLTRTREAALWEIEEKQIHEKHQLMKRQLKDIFFLQRHQMLIRHDKEMEQVKRRANRKEEELVKTQTTERRSLPKRIRAEMKARELMFRESMRISITGSGDPEMEKNKFKEFQENEKKRYQAEQNRFELKHKRQLEELRAMSDATIKELEQLQNEKRKLLMEHETRKLKEREEAFNKELKEWKAQLKPRKQGKDEIKVIEHACSLSPRLEETFTHQLDEQEKVHGPVSPLTLPPDLPEFSSPEGSRIGHSSTRSSLSSVSES